jgi:hypothetical protein
MRYGYKKTQYLMLNSNPLKKLQEDLCEKSYQRRSDRKIDIFIFFTEYSVQVFDL